MADQTEAIRRPMTKAINADPGSRESPLSSAIAKNPPPNFPGMPEGQVNRRAHATDH